MIIQEETICAIVTPPGTGGISIIRLSGKDAVAIASRLFQEKSGKSLADAESHTIHYGFISDPATGNRIDEVLAGIMRTPRSFTCEDVVEISCHGGPFVSARVLELCLREGARLAEAGEFTRRAFLNGRIDLTQAEAVIDLIRAGTEEGLRCALWQMEGSLSFNINVLHDDLAGAITLLEAHIDFPEDDVPAAVEDVSGHVHNVIKRIDRLIEGYYRWRPFREGILTAIAGRTNVGKSSLLNILTGEERAIVTPLPGTTRDVIEGVVNIHGILLRLLDTAGLRLAEDAAEEEGIRRMHRTIDAAELILLVLDGSIPLTSEDKEILARTTGRKRVIVINKTDKGNGIGRGLNSGNSPVVHTSIINGEGIEDLRNAIFHLITGKEPGVFHIPSVSEESFMSGRLTRVNENNPLPLEKGDKGPLVTNIRHKIALEGAKKDLISFLEAVNQNLPLEILALHLRKAADLLGEITGTVTTEDILDRIFKEFCIGK